MRRDDAALPHVRNHWFPFKAVKDACPKCGCGLTRCIEAVSPDAVDEHKRLSAERASADKHSRFEAMYALHVPDPPIADQDTDELDAVDPVA